MATERQVGQAFHLSGEPSPLKSRNHASPHTVAAAWVGGGTRFEFGRSWASLSFSLFRGRIATSPQTGCARICNENEEHRMRVHDRPAAGKLS
eukprot:354143-Chlamydomonas_euryale.AAC.3